MNRKLCATPRTVESWQDIDFKAAENCVKKLQMFDDISTQLRSRAIQEAMLGIKAKYGKNAILKGVNYDPAATGRERNLQIGGHKSNG